MNVDLHCLGPFITHKILLFFYSSAKAQVNFQNVIDYFSSDMSYGAPQYVHLAAEQLFEIFTQPTPQGRFAPSGALYKIILTQSMPYVTTVTLNNFESINSMQPKAALTTYADDVNHTTIIM